MILLYHKVYLENPTGWWMKIDEFYRQMVELRHKKVVYLDDYNPKNPNHVVITFDGIYENVVDYAVPILKNFAYPYELFIIGKAIGKDNGFDKPEPFAKFASREQLKEAVRAGGRLQWHTMTHPNMDDMSDVKKIEQELKVPSNIRSLDRLGFKWFAYPHGEHNELVVNAVKKSFRGGLSCNQGNDADKYKLNRIIVFNETTFKKATIAVIIPSYNYGRFLVEAIESVLKQTRLPDEILISDDASVDNTLEIAKVYQKRFPELIKVNSNKKNLGIVKHFNKAVRLTKSDYVCFLGADNRFRSDYLEKTSVIMDSDEKLGVVYTDFAMFGPRAKLVYDSSEKNRRGEIKGNLYILRFPEFKQSSKRALRTKNFIHGSSLFRRNAWKMAGGYKESNNIAEDHNLFLRIINLGWKAKRAPVPLLEYRHHSSDQSHAVYGSYSELNFYKREYNNMLPELKNLRDELTQIKSSKFWLILYILKQPKVASAKIISKFKREGFKAFKKYI